MRVVAMVCAGVLWAGAVGAASAGEIMDAKFGTARGGQADLAGYRGKPVVLFFEDRDSPDLNKEFKDALFRMGKERELLDAAHVVAVANLQPFDFFPAREFALAAVRKEEQRWGIPILIDWKGQLAKSPWGLPGDTSTIVLLDAEGRLLFARSGELSSAEQQRFFAELERQIGK